MVAKPAFTGAAIPAAVTVAKVSFEETQDALSVTTSVALLDKIAVATKATGRPSTVVGFAGVTVMDCTLAATVSRDVPDDPW